MKYLQTIAGLSAKSGGTSSCTYSLIKAMHDLDCDVDLMTIHSQDLLGDNEPWIKSLPNDCKTNYGYSHNVNKFLRGSTYELYHTNGLWMHCNHQTCLEARRKNKPYIITPHGMLYPQALAKSSWKKRILLAIGGVAKDLRDAVCIHTTCRVEMEHYKNLGYHNPVAIIPNPIPIPDFVNRLIPSGERNDIGYLGRLHPYKRPDALIEAWAQIGNATNGRRLIFLGQGSEDYEMYLRKLVKSYDLNNVQFLGMVQGEEKYRLLASMRALCVPSKSENFGMVVAEALLVHTPVICTNTAPWEELKTHHCGWWIPNDINTLSQSINEALQLTQGQIATMGLNGRRLIEEKYTDKKVAANMLRLYDYILNGGSKPEFVYD